MNSRYPQGAVWKRSLAAAVALCIFVAACLGDEPATLQRGEVGDGGVPPTSSDADADANPNSDPEAGADSGPHCLSTPVRLGAAIDSDADVVTKASWFGPTEARKTDGVGAKVSLISGKRVSRLLAAHNFGLQVPTDATVTGVTTTVIWKTSVSGPKGSVWLTTTDLVAAAPVRIDNVIPTSLTTLTHGGPNDRWGAYSQSQFNADFVNSPDFGVGVTVYIDSVNPADVEVDSIEVQVHYCVP